MAVHSANGVSYYLALPLAQKERLGALRHWQNLKVAFDEETVWVKEFTPAQIDGTEVKTLPHKTIYVANGPQLYLQGSLLPERLLPSLLWTPIERGLPLRLPAFNHNYFGLAEKIAVRLKPAESEKEAWACLVKRDLLNAYAEGAPAVRMQGLNWVLAGHDEALLTGTPLLPLPGDTFWRQGDLLFPSGYELEWPLLADTLQKVLNPQGSHWVVWTKDGSYWRVPKQQTVPLSRGSVRLSTEPF